MDSRANEVAHVGEDAAVHTEEVLAVGRAKFAVGFGGDMVGVPHWMGMMGGFLAGVPAATKMGEKAGVVGGDGGTAGLMSWGRMNLQPDVGAATGGGGGGGLTGSTRGVGAVGLVIETQVGDVAQVMTGVLPGEGTAGLVAGNGNLKNGDAGTGCGTSGAAGFDPRAGPKQVGGGFEDSSQIND